MKAVRKSPWPSCQPLNHMGRENITKKTANTPNRNNNNDPGFPIFIRRDHCALSLSTRKSTICPGRSSDSPSALAAFPPGILSAFISPESSESLFSSHDKKTDKKRKQWRTMPKRLSHSTPWEQQELQRRARPRFPRGSLFRNPRKNAMPSWQG